MANFAATQNSPNTKKPNRTFHSSNKAADQGGRAVRPRPKPRPNGAWEIRKRRPRRGALELLYCKERKKNIVKPKHKANQKFAEKQSFFCS